MKRWLALIALLVSAPAWGAEWKAWIGGSELFQVCSSSLKSGEAQCSMYSAAVAEFVRNQGFQGERMCPPPAVSVRQIGLIVTKYLKEHPEELHYSGGYLAAHALILAFPCSDGEK